MRSKEQDPDYRFMPDPDIPRIRITQGMIDKAQSSLPELPFDQKKRIASLYDIGIRDAETVLSHPHVHSIFEDLSQNLPSKQVYQWVYVNILGNTIKKELDFEETVS